MGVGREKDRQTADGSYAEVVIGMTVSCGNRYV